MEGWVEQTLERIRVLQDRQDEEGTGKEYSDTSDNENASFIDF